MASPLVTREFTTRYEAQWLRHALSFTFAGDAGTAAWAS